jgi:hypothetical protein
MDTTQMPLDVLFADLYFDFENGPRFAFIQTGNLCRFAETQTLRLPISERN